MTSKISFIPSETELGTFWYWINERHSIYLARQAGKPFPWTKDKILREYKFTNVFRELDAGTVYYAKCIREPYADHPELFFNTCLYRTFNRITTAEVLGFIEAWDPDEVEAKLRKLAETKPVYTNAYLVTGTLGGGDKIYQSVWRCLDKLWNSRRDFEPKPGDTLEKAFNRLKKANGFGAFGSYEVVSDLRWTRYLRNAPDIMTWANAGPGAVRGMNRLYGLPLRAREKTKKGKKARQVNRAFPPYIYLEIMRWLLYRSQFAIDSHVPNMELRDVEHSLCEFDKYQRASKQEGRPRMKYKPPITV